MKDKTIRLYGSARLDDESQGSVVASFEMALADLAVKAAHTGREVLWGTVTVDVERRTVEVTKYSDPRPHIMEGPKLINVDAECVKT